jgi:hypothetical protein
LVERLGVRGDRDGGQGDGGEQPGGADAGDGARAAGEAGVDAGLAQAAEEAGLAVGHGLTLLWQEKGLGVIIVLRYPLI